MTGVQTCASDLAGTWTVKVADGSVTVDEGDTGGDCLPDLRRGAPLGRGVAAADAADEQESGEQPAPGGPWGATPETQGGAKPFLPAQPPVELGGTASPGNDSGPWGPHRK